MQGIVLRGKSLWYSQVSSRGFDNYQYCFFVLISILLFWAPSYSIVLNLKH